MWYFWILSKALIGVMPSLSRYIVFLAQGIYIAFTLSHPISNKAYVELIGVEITNALGLIKPWIQMNSPHNPTGLCMCGFICGC